MPHLPLRTKLTLAFLVLAALMVGVGVTTVLMHGRIRDQAAALRPEDIVDLRRVDLGRSGLEIQGRWDPSGVFRATDVELLPAIHDPKLRGAVQAIDPAAGTFTLFGLAIRIDADTRRADGEPGRVDLASLAPGLRVEVTCDVSDGDWKAEKIAVAGVKASDKIKAMVTAAELNGDGSDLLELNGLKIAVAGSAGAAPDGALNHVRTATHLLIAALEFRASARELLPVEAGGPGTAGDPAHARGRLRRAADAFADDLAGVSGATDGPWLEPVLKVAPELRRRIDALILASIRDPDETRRLLAEEFVPFLERDLEPRVLAYLSQSEDALGADLENIVAETETTAFVAIATSAVALLAALVLGFFVWRSIHRPVAALQAAAVRLGQGHLDTRVELVSRDELGQLGAAFNRMAEQLSASTLSIGNLENVFDSMAGALLLLDMQHRIMGVNRAALELLGFAREELQGRPLEHVSPAGLAGTANTNGTANDEHVLIRRNGTTVPVSLSVAKLGSNGSQRGFVCIAHDLTERKHSEARIRSSLAEKEFLLREVHHRVKNNMQVISSLLAMQSLHADDPRLTAGFEESQDRIRSMALIHEQLYESVDLARIDVRMYLDVLIDHLARSHGRGDSIQVELDAQEVPLDIDESLACGLIVNELVVNAFKHAFADGRNGKIRVSLALNADGEAELSVSDDGRGLAQPHGTHETLGLSLVATLAAQLGGRHEIESAGGLCVRVTFPCTRPELAA